MADISPRLCDVAVKRWQVETGRVAVLDGDGGAKEERIGSGPDQDACSDEAAA